MNQLSGRYKLISQRSLRTLLHFLAYLYQRMKHDRVNISAGYLAYITILSLVPMVTVLFSILSSFSFFDNTGAVIQDFVIRNFMPTAGDAVNQALKDFVSNTGKMTAFGVLFLFIAAMMLISNIDKNLNYIWRIKQKRRAIYSFSMYWMVLTLGPIFIGASIAATSYITSLRLMQFETLSGAYNMLLSWLPFLISIVAFIGLYMLVPNTKVKSGHALTGAVIAALLFELSKRGFALYITQFPSYQLIYGALATIPILFVWVYLCWLITLFGAEVTAALGEGESWREEKDMVHSKVDSNHSEKESSCDSSDPESK
ncbi:virulence factor BrkB family protein [Vibrio hannami]|uniref:virulence factor BrkB family protein n=1 Tax=Vibrio hannami TaxID=2717094 RepID=UPI00240EF2A8|nr:virulence factor BrkB family protein [Vibrio hannami]MDG3086845.1 virulence factor BrkB family protein [Vibrio hannami]